MKPSTCSSCGAQILWAVINGKPIPLNWRRVRAYVVEDYGKEEFKELLGCDLGGAHDLGDDPLLVRVSHFISCPQASEHSRG